MTLEETMSGSPIILYIIAAVFAVMGTILILGRGKNLIAGYNTASAEEKQKYNAKRLCTVIGSGLLAIAVMTATLALFRSILPSWISYVFGAAVVADCALLIILSNTVCREHTAKTLEMKIIGQTVSGIIDRPAGSRHPDYPDTVYPVNYGYAVGVFAPDGEEQDVYVLGTDQPMQTFSGKVIAVYLRYNDAEEKWIVSLDGKDYTDEEILDKIDFIERYFPGKLIR